MTRANDGFSEKTDWHIHWYILCNQWLQQMQIPAPCLFQGSNALVYRRRTSPYVSILQLPNHAAQLGVICDDNGCRSSYLSLYQRHPKPRLLRSCTSCSIVPSRTMPIRSWLWVSRWVSHKNALKHQNKTKSWDPGTNYWNWCGRWSLALVARSRCPAESPRLMTGICTNKQQQCGKTQESLIWSGCICCHLCRASVGKYELTAWKSLQAETQHSVLWMKTPWRKNHASKRSSISKLCHLVRKIQAVEHRHEWASLDPKSLQTERTEGPTASSNNPRPWHPQLLNL